MGRARSALAVLPALLPGALVLLLAFQSGGFSPASWAPVAGVGMIVLALRVTTVERPFAGISGWTAVAIGALALFGAWTLLSAQWGGAPGRAVVEFGRLVAYLVALVLCASLVPQEGRAAWAVRGVAVAIGVVCVAALVSRLRPDLLAQEGLVPGRLDFPITYWNGLGMLAGVGGVLGLHLSASQYEPRVVRVLAAALVPIAACTVYFTLSRGAVVASAVGVVAYLVLGFSRATPGALLALVPPTVLVVQRAYDAELLVESDFASAAGMAQGREVAAALVIAVGAAMALRALALLVDLALERVPGPGRLPVPVRVAAAFAVLALVVGVAVAQGAPGWVREQADTFLNASSGPAPDPADVRDRLTQVNSNGRVGHWKVAVQAWEDHPVRGNGAGTYQNLWNRDREIDFQVLDAHSLYLEVLSELGVVGLALLLAALGAIVAGLLWRLRGPGRPVAAATVAAVTAWGVHAGVDWDWELAAVTIWVFGLAGIVLARQGPAAGRPMPRLLRLLVALGCLGLALSPLALWRSQGKLREAYVAFQAGDCPATIDSALDSLAAVGARAEPWELIAYCNVRLGQEELAIGAAEAAVRRDPGNWEYHYTLGLVRAVAREDPRAAIAEARRLNPIQVEPKLAQRAFKTRDKAAWERRARRLKLYLR